MCDYLIQFVLYYIHLPTVCFGAVASLCGGVITVVLVLWHHCGVGWSNHRCFGAVASLWGGVITVVLVLRHHYGVE